MNFQSLFVFQYVCNSVYVYVFVSRKMITGQDILQEQEQVEVAESKICTTGLQIKYLPSKHLYQIILAFVIGVRIAYSLDQYNTSTEKPTLLAVNDLLQDLQCFEVTNYVAHLGINKQKDLLAQKLVHAHKFYNINLVKL